MACFRAPATAVAVCLVLALTATTVHADDNIWLGATQPGKVSPTDDRVALVFRTHRNIHYNLGVDGPLVVSAQLTDESGTVIGQASAPLLPGQEGVKIVLSQLATPLPLGGLAGEVFVSPPTNDGGGDAPPPVLVMETFSVNVVPHSLSIVSTLPRRVTSRTRELVLEYDYVIPAVSADTGVGHVLVCILKSPTGEQVGRTVVALSGGRGRVTARVAAADGSTVLPTGEARLIAIVTPEDSQTFQSRILRVLTPIIVNEVDAEVKIVSLDPRQAVPSTTAVSVRVSVNQFEHVTQGPLPVGDGAGGIVVLVTLRNSNGDAVGRGQAIVDPNARFVFVPVDVTAGPLEVGTLSVVVFTAPRDTPTWDARTAVARAIWEVMEPHISFSHGLPVALSPTANSLRVNLVYAVDVSVMGGGWGTCAVMIRGDSGRVGKAEVELTAAHGDISVDVPITNPPAYGAPPVTVLAFIVPLTSSRTQWSDAAVSARHSLPVDENAEPEIELLGASRSTRDGSRYVHLRIKHSLAVDSDEPLAVNVQARFNTNVVGKTWHPLEGHAGVVDVDVMIYDDAAANPTDMLALIYVTPASSRRFSSALARTTFVLDVTQPVYNPQDHRVAVTGTLARALFTRTQLTTVYVSYNLEGLARMQPGGAGVFPAGATLRVLANQDDSNVASGTITLSEMSGELAVALEFKPIAAGTVELRAELHHADFAAKLNKPLGWNREVNVKSDLHAVQVNDLPEAFMQAMRTVPSVAPAGVASTIEVDVDFDLRGVCGTKGDCSIRLKAVQDRSIIASSEFPVNGRVTAAETVPLQLPASVQAGTVLIRILVVRRDDAGQRTAMVRGEPVTVLVQHMPEPCAGEPAPQRKKNVLFFMMDDLGTQVGAYGDATAVTPNMDALARRGVLFSRQYVDQPTCIPARAAMLTGVRCTRSGQQFGQHTFRRVQGIQTAPEIFHGNGYATYAFGKVFHFRTETNGTTEIFNGGRSVKYVDPALNLLSKVEGTAPLSEFADATPLSYTDGQVARHAVSVIDTHKRTRQPFWLAVGFNKPHVPWTAPKYYLEAFQGTSFAAPAQQRLPSNVDPQGPADNIWADVKGYPPLNRLNPHTASVPWSEKKNMRVGYKASTAFCDDMIGQVVASLGCLADDTHILLWGDQGWHLGEQGLWGKNTMFEMVLRSPLIVVPASASPQGALMQQPFVQDTVVESVDILPTMLELCGIERDGNMLDGRSLVSLLQPGPTEERVAYTMMRRSHYIGYSVRTSRYRYTEWVDYHTGSEIREHVDTSQPDLHISTLLEMGAAPQRQWTELYDFADGPLERNNIAFRPANAQLVQQLAELLRVKTEGPREGW